MRTEEEERAAWREVWGVEPGGDVPAGSRLDAELSLGWQAIDTMRVLAEQHAYDRDRLLGLVDEALKNAVVEEELERIERIAKDDLVRTPFTHALLAHVRAIRRALAG